MKTKKTKCYYVKFQTGVYTYVDAEDERGAEEEAMRVSRNWSDATAAGTVVEIKLESEVSI
tara:strand:+ start:216 stop:398 length:183 start_codon:yes stop_codon:yes gene_type:complete